MKKFDQIELVLYGGLGITDQQTLALTFVPVPTKAKKALTQKEIPVGVVAHSISSPHFCEEREF